MSWLQGWLSNLSLAEYVDTLSHHGYTSAESLASILERDQLKAIGITKMGHVNRLFRAIEKLRGEAGEDSSSPSLPRENSGSRLANSAPAQVLVSSMEDSKPTSKHFSIGDPYTYNSACIFFCV